MASIEIKSGSSYVKQTTGILNLQCHLTLENFQTIYNSVELWIVSFRCQFLQKFSVHLHQGYPRKLKHYSAL